MTKRSIKIGTAQSVAPRPTIIFIKEIFVKLPKRKNVTNKTDAYHFGDTWSMDLFDLINCGPKRLVMDFLQ